MVYFIFLRGGGGGVVNSEHMTGALLMFFSGQCRNCVAQIHFMSIQVRGFG